MSKLLVISDVHTEFMRDGGGSFVKDLNKDVDVLIVAGDLAVGSGITGALRLLCRAYAHASVVYLTGNHEYYGYTPNYVHELVERACERHLNLRWIRAGESVRVGSQRFIGGTMWFPKPPSSATKQRLNDFKLIKDFEPWVYAENRTTVRALERGVKSTDVVVTHHLPSQRSVAPEYRGSDLNSFFVCDMEHVIRERKPKLWIHGHGHNSVDYDIGKTRVVCNPFGYALHEENDAFDYNNIIEL